MGDCVYLCDKPMTQSTDYPRRFMAGASCMKCRQVDTTVIFSVEGKYHIECITCGFTQCQDDIQSTAADKQSQEVPLQRLKRREQD